ncbi:MAG: 40S ribosomal protein S19, partial [Candidatus Bathyarchaeia archaeon]
GPIGISRLSKEYGGRTERGTRPEHFRRGGRSILRKALQQLEAAELVKTEERKGRVLTEEGWGLADRLAGEIKRELVRSVPELKKY